MVKPLFLSRYFVVFAIAGFLITILALTFFPLRGELPLLEDAIYASERVLSEEVCPSYIQIITSDPKTLEFFGDGERNRVFQFEHEIKRNNGMSAFATTIVWGRSSALYRMLNIKSSSPVVDILGVENRCGGQIDD